jgi:oligopeptide/dipeptide ABC transporter ATP-binding protein
MTADPVKASLNSHDEPVIAVSNLRTTFRTRSGTMNVVDGVTLNIGIREALGIVGESGSGKSMLVRSIMGLLPPGARRSGDVTYQGRNLVEADSAALRDLWGSVMAMVPQDPMLSLNPVRRIGVQLIEPLRLHLKLNKDAARERALELMGMVGLPDPVRRFTEYPHQLSGGMRQRVLIAAALACDPRVLFADEPTTALDVTVQAQILVLLRSLQQEKQMAMVLVTHDLGVVAGCTDRVIVMYAGRIVEAAPTPRLFSAMRMPYTQALFNSIPRLDLPVHTRLEIIPGGPPDPAVPLAGCRFAARCPYVQDKCLEAEPPLVASDDDASHKYRCWFPVERPASMAAAPLPSESRVVK